MDWHKSLRLLAPTVISGALLAFLTSFDEAVFANFLAGPGLVTLPKAIFEFRAPRYRSSDHCDFDSLDGFHCARARGGHNDAQLGAPGEFGAHPPRVDEAV